ncbi:MAG: methylated-DNA--[protein]-cysteine S-methyltransferase [Magnetococcales bacterium]|nr:methylated-DNA--[protein]-cysteine S-methyltransferase [Magnetococcales bacterium]
MTHDHVSPIPFPDFDTPLGPYWLQTHVGAIVALHTEPAATPPDPVLRQQVAEWLNAYFQGHFLPLDDLPLAPNGTPFQRRVWMALREISPGRIESYGALAQRVNSAPRAVGAALGANPLPILLPCHRVLAADGTLRGYSGRGGLESKRFLLRLEGIEICA